MMNKKLTRLICFLLTCAIIISVFSFSICESKATSQVDQIIAFARSQIGQTKYDGMCQAFVRSCYESAGIYASTNAGSANDAWKMWGVSTSSSNIPVGACVYFRNGTSDKYGHVGLYIGDGKMIDATSSLHVSERTIPNYLWGQYQGWGYQAGKQPSSDSSVTKATITINAVTNLSYTNAQINGTVNNSNKLTCTSCGFRVGVSTSNYTEKSESINLSLASFAMWYDMNKWYGTLTPGQTYYYQMFVTADGNTYWTDWNKFTTPCINYTITGASNNEKYGTVSGSGTYKRDAAVTLTATPKAGYQFVCWQEGAASVSTSNQYKFIATANRTLTAVFALIDKPNPKAVSTGYKSIKISWSKVSGANGYEIYRSTTKGGTYKLIKATSSTSYSDTSLKTNQTYYYKLRACCETASAKTYSGDSNIVSAVPIPSTPSAKAVRVSNSSIKISWGKIAGATKYEVYRATSKNGSYKLIKTTTSTSYTNIRLINNRTYYYKLRVYHLINGKKAYSGYSAIISATP